MRFIQKVAKRLKIQTVGYWATPCTTAKYESFKSDSEVIDYSNKVNLYERNVQLKHMTVTQAPIFLDAIQAAKPSGVTISLHKHDQEVHTLIRYIPDLQLAALEKELEEI